MDQTISLFENHDYANDPYSTHLPILRTLFRIFRPQDVWEFGMGLYSTPFFVAQCRKVISVEMQDEKWFESIIQKVSSPNFKPILSLGPTDACRLLKSSEDKFDLIFVDGHGDSRYNAVNEAFDKTDVIVMHDTETPLYFWNRIIVHPGWYWIDFKKYNPWTSVIVKGPVKAIRTFLAGLSYKPSLRIR